MQILLDAHLIIHHPSLSLIYTMSTYNHDDRWLMNLYNNVVVGEMNFACLCVFFVQCCCRCCCWSDCLAQIQFSSSVCFLCIQMCVRVCMWKIIIMIIDSQHHHHHHQFIYLCFVRGCCWPIFFRFSFVFYVWLNLYFLSDNQRNNVRNVPESNQYCWWIKWWWWLYSSSVDYWQSVSDLQGNSTKKQPWWRWPAIIIIDWP